MLFYFPYKSKFYVLKVIQVIILLFIGTLRYQEIIPSDHMLYHEYPMPSLISSPSPLRRHQHYIHNLKVISLLLHRIMTVTEINYDVTAIRSAAATHTANNQEFVFVMQQG